MRSSFPIKAFFILALCFATALTSYSVNYTRPANPSNSRSSFYLPSTALGDVVVAYISQTSGSNSLIVNLWPPFTQQYFGTVEQTATLSGSIGLTKYTSNPLAQIGSYILEILPVSADSPTFSFHIRIEVNNQTVGTFSDAARYNRIFSYYHLSQGSYQVTVNPSVGYESSYWLEVFGPFTNPQVGGGSLVINTSPEKQNSISYTSNGGQYFYIVVHLDDSYLRSNQNINIQYSTDIYACPFNSIYSDYNGVYQGCTHDMPTVGYPCSNYNPSLLRCLSCYSPWVANSAGVCIQDTTCPSNQYYSFGNCYDVISNCNKFDFFGGLCSSCKEGYNLTNYKNGTQQCIQVQETCTSNQYLRGNTCYDLIANCNNFQTASGICLNCKTGFVLQDNQCNIQPSNPLYCPLGQTNTNGVCTTIDQYCLFFYPNNTCMVCTRGYSIIDQSCSKIICGPRQSSGSGSCVDVSPFCNTFDPIYGNCLTCINLYYLLLDGTCIQGLPSQLATSSNSNLQTSGCPDGYYIYQGTCIQVSPTCGRYDPNTGQCITCKDSTYYLNKTNGGCLLISNICSGRFYFSNGNCIQISNLCDQFDNTNGNCLSCRDGSVLTNNQCAFIVICGNGQYHAADGTCTNVSDKCGTYDPSNGYCLSCISNYELNEGGVCCYAYNYMDDPKCVAFYSKNCASQRPKFNYCLLCNSGYSLTNGVFGRCNINPDISS